MASRPDAYLSHTPFVHAGPLTRTVADAALMFQAMAGPHPRDPLSLPHEDRDYMAVVANGDVDGLRIAFSPNFDVFPVDDEVGGVVREAVIALEQAGAVVEQVVLGLNRLQEELANLWVRQMGVLYAEVAELFKPMGVDLAGKHRGEVASEFVRMIDMGRSQSALQYKMDDSIRTEVFDALQNVFEQYDLLVTPTLAVLSVDNATDGNTLGPTDVCGETVDPCIGWCLTYPVNFSGHPAASLPAGWTRDGMPIGLQLIGRRHADAELLAASAAIERIRPWHDHYLKLERNRKGRTA